MVVVPQTKEGKGNLRVIHRDQLQVIRAGGNPRVPDCYQKTPKRIPVSEQGQILTVAVDGRGKLMLMFFVYRLDSFGWISFHLFMPFLANTFLLGEKD